MSELYRALQPKKSLLQLAYDDYRYWFRVFNVAYSVAL